MVLRARLLRGWWCATLLVLLAALPSLAQDRGFRPHRFDGSSVGSRLFLLERPWYSSTRVFSAGLTLDYAANPLVVTLRNRPDNHTFPTIATKQTWPIRQAFDD